MENPTERGAGLSDRQREIVEASIRLIAKGGIQELTTKNLAARLGLSEPALYRHFKNKQDILLALLNFFKAQQKAMYARVAAAESSPTLALERMIGEVFRNFSARPAMAAVIFAEGMFQNDSRLSKVLFSIMQDRQEQFAFLITQGQALGEIRRDLDEDQLALIAMGSMRLLVTRWRLSKFDFDLVEEGERLLATIRQVLQGETSQNHPYIKEKEDE